VRRATPNVLGVLVTADFPLQEVLDQAKATGADVIQLHGSEPAGVATELRIAGYLTIKAVPIGSGAPDHDWLNYPCDYRLLDTFHSGISGGTGRLLDHSLLPTAAMRGSAPLLLAGGLTPDNLLESIRRVLPHGVDVSSGVETLPGIKDPEKVRRFLQLARRA
jgi:phosphoribosylanthranilate isomerase